MKKILLILLCLPMIGFGQGWVNTYNISFNGNNGNISNSVKETTDGGYISFGTIIIKTDSVGDTIWTKPYWANSGTQTIDGGYAFLGDGLIKTNSFGDTIWTKPLFGRSLRQVNDGGYVFLAEGPLTVIPDPDEQIYLNKTDSAGNLLWNKSYFPFSISGNSNAYNVEQTIDGGYIVFGSLNQNPILIKTDSNGDSIWTKSFTNIDRILNGIQTNDGGYIFTGFTNSNSIPIIKTDSLGNIIWQKFIQYSYEVAGGDIYQTTDNGYVIIGEQDINANYDLIEILLLRLDVNGDTIWTKSFGCPYGYGTSVQETSDGGFIMGGGCWQGINTSGQPYGEEIILIKTNHLGTLTSTTNLPINTSKGKLLKVTDILGKETKGKKNEPLFYIYDDGTVEKRIVIE